MAKTALITGITGQDGSYLSDLLVEKGYTVVGLVSQKYNIGWQNVEHIKEKLVLADGDLLDKESMRAVFKKYQPQEIYNLGGLTFIPQSWEKPTLTFDINTLGVARLLELMVEELPESRMFQASSAKMFGIPSDVPQTEKTRIAPTDPYSVSKAAAHFLIGALRQEKKLFAVSGIMYNHESERRGVEFVTRKISQGAARIKLGLEKSLPLGNLEATQDWGYAPDYVEAMWLTLQQEKPDDYIISSGTLHTVRDICEVAFGYLKLKYQDFVTIDKQFLRQSEHAQPQMVGDATKAKTVLGWRPKTSFEEMIITMVEHDVAEASHK